MIVTHIIQAVILLITITGQVYAAPMSTAPNVAEAPGHLFPRVKVGGAKPPTGGPPPKKTTPPATVNPAPASKASTTTNVCTNIQGCSKCVADVKCGFSKTAFTCQLRSGSGQTSNQVQSNVGCGQMNQQQGVFPAVNSVKKAGIITADVNTEFNRISNHIFNGETTSKTSGRHTTAAWLAANPGQNPIETNANTHILKFPSGNTGKTVWDSAFYSKVDIQNMCAVAIKLANGVAEGAFVVQTPFGQPACINHFTKGTGSCFPLGTTAPTQTLGSQC